VLLPLIPKDHSEIAKASWPLSGHPGLDPHCLVTQTNGAPLKRVWSEVGLWLVWSPSPVDHLLGKIKFPCEHDTNKDKFTYNINQTWGDLENEIEQFHNNPMDIDDTFIEEEPTKFHCEQYDLQ
jgi:hypothetical protein